MRPLFEPTDLEMERTGVLDIDVQVGAIRSPGPWRAVMPDFELDFGLLPYLELDLDGAYAVESPSTGRMASVLRDCSWSATCSVPCTRS
jgi:hypothetical protein